MATDLLRLFPRPADLLTALRRITVGGLLAAAGLSIPAAAGPAATADRGPLVQATTIVDRSRKKPALLLRLPNSSFTGDPQHRSHRSHSSHRSGSSGGSVAAPVAPRKAEPTKQGGSERRVGPNGAIARCGNGGLVFADLGAATCSGSGGVTEWFAPLSAAATSTAPPAAMGLLGNSAASFTGVIEAIDRQVRTITIRMAGTPTTRIFAYRDDSKLQTVTGSSIRFDEFGEMSGGQIPVANNDKVQVTWRTSTDGKTSIITTVTKTP